MAQGIVTLATVISIKPLGENNSSVCFLTQSMGIVYATMYGGRKSRLRSLVSTWNTGMAYFSVTNQTKQLKISDFDVKNYHLTFRDSLVKTWAASLAAELAIKTKCAGSSENCWALTNGFLDGLEYCTSSDQCSLGLLRFLWRYLELLGIQPSANACARCETVFSGGNSGGKTLYYNKGAFFSPSENGFLCTDCVSEKMPFFLNAEAVNYLSALSVLTPQEVRAIPLSKDAADQIKNLVFFLIESAVGTRLNSLETGTGIL